MPNGRNSGRLYPGVPGDYEVIIWTPDEDDPDFGYADLKWEKEGTQIVGFGRCTRAHAEHMASSYSCPFRVA